MTASPKPWRSGSDRSSDNSCVRRTGLVANREGASAVEFAIIAPLALLILIGIIAYGLIFSVHLSLQHLIAETGRATIAGLGSAERAELARTYFRDKVAVYPLLDADAADLQVTDDGRYTEVVITYAVENHPAYVFEGLLPLPASPYVYRQTIRNGGG